MQSNHSDGTVGHKKHLWHVWISKPKKHRKRLQNAKKLAITVFLISLYGAPLAQRVSLALHSSLFGPDGTVDYDYIITNSIKSLLIG